MNIAINTSISDLYEKIVNPKYDLKDINHESLILWKQIAVSECIEYLIDQFDKVGFDFEAGEKTYKTFELLLENFSVAQIYGIIWRAVADSSKLYLEKNITKKHAANSTIGACQRYAERALLNGWKLTEYSRPKNLPQSELSRFFFNKVLQIGDLGFTMPPTSL